MVKTYAFIDASNIIYGTRDEGWKVDFRKLYKYLTERYECKKIYYCGKQVRKANCDVDLTFHAMRDKDLFKRAIFLSGDGDFEILLRYFIELGKEVMVVANRNRTAIEIRKTVGKGFVELGGLRKILQKNRR